MRCVGFAFERAGGGFRRVEYELAPAADEVVVAVAGCGLCHTDIGFYYGEVAPRRALPLVLGHEISGTVVEVGAACRAWQGARVIVPAVMPCDACPNCRAGFPNTCRRQLMPGNDAHGGFASHVLAPARHLARLPADLRGHELADLSVIADAVTTPYQSIARAGVEPGDVAIVIGVGGIGTYGVQIAKARGAQVIAIDIDAAKLERIRAHGADRAIDVRELDLKAARAAVRAVVEELGGRDFAWKLFEMSGTKAGQEMAFHLLPPSGTLAIVGFTPAKVELRLSNLMAFDATCFGNWGCAPEHYAQAIDLVLDGRVHVEPFVKRYPLDDLEQLFDAAHRGALRERPVLIPQF